MLMGMPQIVCICRRVSSSTVDHGNTAQQLLDHWQPWHLLSTLSSTAFTPMVDGAAMSLDADGDAADRLHLQARLQLHG